MVAASATTAANDGKTRVVDLPFPWADGDDAFSRADVVFVGLDHSAGSYEIRLFLNNPAADANTARTADQGYAGRLHVLGHGGCYGGLGHCDIPQPAADSTDLRGPHPLTPIDTYVTITDQLRQLLDGGASLRTITLVPISVTPQRKARQPAPELMSFTDVSLQTFVSTDDEPPA